MADRVLRADLRLGGGKAATIQYNYDCVFAGPSLAYVSHADSTWTSTEIVLLDVQQQTTAVFALVGGPSAPLALDGSGGLSVTGLNSGWAGTVHVQGALFDAGFRPLGTTERLAIAFQ